MTSRDNLIPTPTVDKNGRATTVYKKASTGARASSMPRVAPGKGVEQRSRLALSADLLKAWPSYDEDSEKGQNLIMALNLCSGEELIKLEELRQENNDVFRKLGYLSSDTPTGVKEGMYFYPEMSEMSYSDARDIMESLHGYSQLPDTTDFSTQPDEVRSQCKALINVTVALIDQWRRNPRVLSFRPVQPPYSIKDESLVEFVMDHPDESGLIADFIRKGGSTDTEILSQLLDSQSHAIASGLL